MSNVEPFTSSVADEVIDDMRHRLRRTRWPRTSGGEGWERGVDLPISARFAPIGSGNTTGREQEALLNQLPQYTTEVDGVLIHFVRTRSVGPNPMPLLLTHGWPDSFHRFHKVIPMLTDPERYGGSALDAFDVIVPSIPGFAFRPGRTGEYGGR